MGNAWNYLNEESLDLKSISDVLNGDSSQESLQTDILRNVVKYFGADCGQFCLHDSTQPVASKEKTALVNLTWHYTEQYISYYHDFDPFINTLPQLGAIRDTDLIPHSSWSKCEFNNDFIKPQKQSHLLVIRIHEANRMIGHLGVFNSDRNRFFSKKDLFKAQYLSTIFSQNLRLRQMTRNSSGLEAILGQVAGLSYTDVVVLDSNLFPIYWNARSPESCLADLGGGAEISAPGSYVPVMPPYIQQECIKMRDSLRSKTNLKIENRRLVLWTNQSRQVSVEIIALPQEPRPGEFACHFYFLLILNYVRRAGPANSPVEMQRSKLTGKEIDIARYICQGYTNKEISQQLCISKCTVATHVQHIFDKLGVQRRSQLIHHFMS
jgi:DNA-binding CsgD family transcriptional regulator